MPKPVVVLPEQPQIIYGVFDAYGAPVSVPPSVHSRGPFAVGHKIYPDFGSFRRNDVRPTPEDWGEQTLNRVRERWEANCLAAKRAVLTMKDVLIGRRFERVATVGGWYLRFYLSDDEYITFAPTRGYTGAEIIDRPVDAFTITRVMASEKIFVLDNGTRFSISKKVRMNADTIPQRVVDEIFAD